MLIGVAVLELEGRQPLEQLAIGAAAVVQTAQRLELRLPAARGASHREARFERDRGVGRLPLRCDPPRSGLVDAAGRERRGERRLRRGDRRLASGASSLRRDRKVGGARGTRRGPCRVAAELQHAGQNACRAVGRMAADPASRELLRLGGIVPDQLGLRCDQRGR